MSNEQNSNDGIGMVSHAQNPIVMTYARDFYSAYMASCNGLNYQGLPCPKWDDLTDAVRGHWYVVALRSFALSKAMAGVVPSHIPTEYEFGHLADMQHALGVWREYIA
jgi:hypothetical protein